MQAQLVDMPPWSRGTVRDSAAQIGMPSSTFQYWVKKGLAKRHTNAMCPLLNDNNKKARLAFAMKFLVDPINGLLHDFLDHVHIDEKLFYIAK